MKEITIQDVMSREPCSLYTKEVIMGLVSGRTSAYPDEIAALDIPVKDRVWVLLQMTSDAFKDLMCEKIRKDMDDLRCAIDAIPLRKESMVQVYEYCNLAKNHEDDLWKTKFLYGAMYQLCLCLFYGKGKEFFPKKMEEYLGLCLENLMGAS